MSQLFDIIALNGPEEAHFCPTSTKKKADKKKITREIADKGDNDSV